MDAPRAARFRVPSLVTIVLAAVLVSGVLVGCGSTGDGDGGGGATVASTGGDRSRVIMVTHAPRTDPYWAVVAQGLEQAGERVGVDTEYRGVKENLQDPNEQRRLIEAAIATRPDGLIVTDPFPESLDPVIDKATKSGIPTIIIEGSVGALPRADVLSVVAQDTHRVGVTGGERLKALGARRPLFVTIPPGAIPELDRAAAGFEEGFGSGVESLQVPLDKVNDAVFVKNAVAASLTKDDSLDAVFSLGSALSPAIVQAQRDLGGRADEMAWGSLGLGEPVVAALQADRWDFGVDFQHYNFGYLPVMYLDLYLKYAIAPPPVIPIGNDVITPENVDRVADLQEQNVR